MHSLRLPLPWELGSINLYLVPLRSGWMLIDCGLDTPESLSAFEDQLPRLGIDWREIAIILLTHTHPDHMGLAPKLLERTGAQLYLHGDEFANLERWLVRPSDDDAFQLAGTPPELGAKVHLAMADVEKNFVRLRPDVLLTGGEMVGPARVIHTPGHAPGHVCLELDGSLISGDHLLETITPTIPWMPERDCLGEFLASLENIEQRNIGTVYPAHGNPFQGHREWVRRTTAHHQERCDEILKALPATAHDLVAILWPRRLSAFHYRFAVYEVLAHLEYLRRLSRVVLGPDRVWSSTSGS